MQTDANIDRVIALALAFFRPSIEASTHTNSLRTKPSAARATTPAKAPNADTPISVSSAISTVQTPANIDKAMALLSAFFSLSIEANTQTNSLRTKPSEARATTPAKAPNADTPISDNNATNPVQTAANIDSVMALSLASFRPSIEARTQTNSLRTKPSAARATTPAKAPNADTPISVSSAISTVQTPANIDKAMALLSAFFSLSIEANTQTNSLRTKPSEARATTPAKAPNADTPISDNNATNPVQTAANIDSVMALSLAFFRLSIEARTQTNSLRTKPSAARATTPARALKAFVPIRVSNPTNRVQAPANIIRVIALALAFFKPSIEAKTQASPLKTIQRVANASTPGKALKAFVPIRVSNSTNAIQAPVNIIRVMVLAVAYFKPSMEAKTQASPLKTMQRVANASTPGKALNDSLPILFNITRTPAIAINKMVKDNAEVIAELADIVDSR